MDCFVCSCPLLQSSIAKKVSLNRVFTRVTSRSKLPTQFAEVACCTEFTLISKDFTSLLEKDDELVIRIRASWGRFANVNKLVKPAEWDNQLKKQGQRKNVECFLCSCTLDPNNIKQTLSLNRIFAYIHTRFKPRTQFGDVVCCARCSTTSNDFTNLIEESDELHQTLRSIGTKFRSVSKLDNVDDWDDQLRQQRQQTKNIELEKRIKEDWARLGFADVSILYNLQPKLVMWRLDFALSSKDLDRVRLEAGSSKNYKTAYICPLCEIRECPKLFSSQQEVERHKWGRHIAQTFIEIQPEYESFDEFEGHLLESIIVQIRSMKLSPPNGDSPEYSCKNCDYSAASNVYCNNSAMYYHLVEFHFQEFSISLKVRMKDAKRKLEERLKSNKFCSVIKPKTHLFYMDPVSYPLCWWKNNPLSVDDAGPASEIETPVEFPTPELEISNTFDDILVKQEVRIDNSFEATEIFPCLTNPSKVEYDI